MNAKVETAEREVDILRRMGPIGRLKAAFGLYDFTREHLTANFRKKHPDWREERIRAAVRERLLAIR